jgi:serine/threonine protein kinase
MNPIPDDPTMADDPRLLRAAQEYLGELEAGIRPNRAAFTSRFPELSEALVPYLDALDLVHAAASEVRSPTRDGAAFPAVEELAAEPLGDFHIVREIGRGGMGVVYEAVQRSLGRRVALKVLPFAAALDSRQLQRFRNEAQAAAQLHHQNIVPVYAVGAERGVHFYAMQLIEGQNLAALIAQLAPDATVDEVASPHGRARSGVAAAATRPGLGEQLTTQRSQRVADFFRTIATLIAQAADGLDYAHGLGIVHRDVKPANLLVDARGTVWITDFGLAQFHANPGLTQSGDLLGTLRYMSPEQAGGQRVLIDHRSDVYSLGATLYELLTLRPIFDGEDRQTLLHKIMHEEPTLPRAIDRAIPPELETVVLKAIAKSPADRYSSAKEVADDLRRFLRHEPIHARRPTFAQRGRKWLRRHPSVLAAAAVLLVLLTAGSLLSAWIIRGEQEKTRIAYEHEREAAALIRAEQEKTRLAYRAEQQRAEEAEAQFRLAQRVVDEMVHISEEELTYDPQLQALRKRLLLSTLGYYQEFIDRRRGDPAAQEELREAKAKVEKMLADHAALNGAGQRILLDQPAVLDDLRLSAPERARIIDLSARQRKEGMELFGQFGKLTADERATRLLELARAHDAAVQSALTPDQLHRLWQIALQLQGVAALRDPEVVAALKLTADQRKRIREIQVEALSGPSDGKRPGGPPDDFRKGKGKGPPDWKFGPPEDSKKVREQKQKVAMERSLALLSEAQLRSWRELAGTPFTGSVHYPPLGSLGFPGGPPVRR